MRAERSLRILLAPSAYYPHSGGIEEVTRRLSIALEGRGHSTLVATNRWPRHTPAREAVDGVAVRRLALELPGRRPAALARFIAVAPRSAGALLRVAAAFRPDVIHVHGAGPNAAYVAALRRPLCAPVIFSAHGEFRNDAHAAFERSAPLRWALRSLVRDAAAVTAPSHVVLEELREELELAAPASVIPNAVEPGEFDVQPPVSPPYVLAAGRLVAQKGIDLVLRAYASARPALAGRRLVVAGDGPERTPLAQLAAQLGIDDAVTFLGAVGRPRLARLMRGAHIFAFPSRREAFGLALLEAMAAGTPAVAARVGGIPEFARDGENALLVAPEDPDALAIGLVRLTDDGALRERLAAGGRAQAAAYSWSRVVPRYEALYRSVARA